MGIFCDGVTAKTARKKKVWYKSDNFEIIPVQCGAVSVYDTALYRSKNSIEYLSG